MMIMKINWKDLGLMYVIGFIWAWFLGFIIEVVNPGQLFLFSLFYFLAFILPFGFYFWRNKSNIKTAASIILIFGLTFLVVNPILQLPLNILFSLPGAMLGIGIPNALSIIGFNTLGIISVIAAGLISGFIAYFITNNYLKRSISK
jgi:hypothetical protein